MIVYCTVLFLAKGLVGLGLVRQTDSQHSNGKQMEKNCYISTAVNTYYAKAEKCAVSL